MKLKGLTGVLLLCVISACAHRNQVIIDPAGVDMNQFNKDLEECQQIAEQVDKRAAAGAVVGAVVGGLMGAAVGDSRTAEKMAGVGAVGGTASGAKQTKQEKDRVVKNCMRNRGYQVLN